MPRKKIEIEFEQFQQPEDLPAKYRELLFRAKHSLEQSYSPYSNFRVAAALELVSGQVITGTNQENASYPLCLCAERVALAAAAAAYPDEAPAAMAITVGRGHSPATPCGACRQVLFETELRYRRPIQLILQAETGPIWVFSSARLLLPFGFGPDMLLPA